MSFRPVAYSIGFVSKTETTYNMYGQGYVSNEKLPRF